MACETPHLMLPYFQIWMTFHFKYIMQFPKQLQRTVCSPGSFSPRKATNAVHFKRHQGFRLYPVNSGCWRNSESKPSLLSLELSHLLHYLLSSIIPLMPSVRLIVSASGCRQNTKASLFSCSPCFIFISIQSLDPLHVTQPSIRPTLLCFFDAVSPEKIKWLQTNVLLPVTLVNQQRI